MTIQTSILLRLSPVLKMNVVLSQVCFTTPAWAIRIIELAIHFISSDKLLSAFENREWVK